MTNRARAHTRNILFAVGIVPAVLVLVFVTKVGLMLSAQAAGDSAYDDGDYTKAGEEFDANTGTNIFQSWIAHFNRGAALFQAEDHEGAIASFEKALANVPDDKECKVRINIALAHEAIGDGLVETDPQGAIDRWQSGRDVLAEGECPDRDEDAKTVDERLKKKIEQEQKKQEEQQDPDENDPEEEKKKQEEEEKKKQELEERNKQGREDRKDLEQYEEYPYEERQPGYSW
ncbi:tetratricopeptide repeat protein [Nocardioides sp. AE5]|uniref:tetratricopeptide repeat protein n=1 Tax=Nocardioides sp. AE5 TaxID=2962573 RepID=UPI0028825782|nr:tetratricopeptide repeat protein [Nocardioides sp. AE5]MDT0201115.1 tetratricopeptide repeat protein [Nocardioides sp. AE5]